MDTTALALINGAADLLGSKAAGETLSADDAQMALRRLNALIDGWGLQPGTITNEQREVFDLVAGRGTPADPYLMGPGATGTNFDTARPVWVKGFGLLLNSTPSPVEIPLTSLTDDAYEALAVKTTPSTQPTDVYFNATFPFASIYLYPIPTSSLNDLVIYNLQALAQFPDLSTKVSLATGYYEALEYNLARRLSAPFSRPVPEDVRDIAKETLRWIKTANTRMVDLTLDPALTVGSRKPWNILAGP